MRAQSSLDYHKIPSTAAQTPLQERLPMRPMDLNAPRPSTNLHRSASAMTAYQADLLRSRVVETRELTRINRQQAFIEQYAGTGRLARARLSPPGTPGSPKPLLIPPTGRHTPTRPTSPLPPLSPGSGTTHNFRIPGATVLTWDAGKNTYIPGMPAKCRKTNRMSFLGPVDKGDWKKKARAFLLKADDDSSGQLDKEEWIDSGMDPDLFDRLDTDASGYLDLDEIEAAFMAGMLDKMPQKKKKKKK